MKNKNSIIAVIISFTMFLLTACGNYSEEIYVVTVQSENNGIDVTNWNLYQ